MSFMKAIAVEAMSAHRQMTQDLLHDDPKAAVQLMLDVDVVVDHAFGMCIPCLHDEMVGDLELDQLSAWMSPLKTELRPLAEAYVAENFTKLGRS